MTPVVYRSFVDGPAGGNPAGVVLTPDPLEAEAMLSITRRMAIPTVAFGVPDDDGAVGTRMFTPSGEIAACGHASAALAAEVYRTSGGRRQDVEVRVSGGTHSLLMWGALDSPTVSMTIRIQDWRSPHPHDLVAETLGVPGHDTFLPAVVVTGLTHLIVPVESEAWLSSIELNHQLWRSLGRSLGIDTFGLIAVGSDSESVVSLRDVCAPIADTEEAASGTTSSAVAWYLSRLGHGSQFTVRQGADMGSPSLLHASVGTDSVRISGVIRPAG